MTKRQSLSSMLDAADALLFGFATATGWFSSFKIFVPLLSGQLGILSLFWNEQPFADIHGSPVNVATTNCEVTRNVS